MGVAANAVVQQQSQWCHEQGALVARLWNLQAQLWQDDVVKRDARIASLSAENRALSDQAHRLEQALKVDRTDERVTALTKQVRYSFRLFS